MSASDTPKATLTRSLATPLGEEGQCIEKMGRKQGSNWGVYVLRHPIKYSPCQKCSFGKQIGCPSSLFTLHYSLFISSPLLQSLRSPSWAADAPASCGNACGVSSCTRAPCPPFHGSGSSLRRRHPQYRVRLL